MKNRFRKYLLLLARLLPLLLLFFVFLIWACSLIVSSGSKQHIYTSSNETPNNKVGLLLGTSKYSPGGHINPFYQYRIDAAVELFGAGKIEYIIVSGDNRHHNYNEPREMRRDLMQAGIPEKRIVADFAGFRTLDSVIRSQKVFMQDSITIISQRFHIERAIFIARHHGYQAVGYAARDVRRSYGFKTYVREYLARVKLMLDLYIYKTEPMFLGEEIEIGKQ